MLENYGTVVDKNSPGGWLVTHVSEGVELSCSGRQIYPKESENRGCSFEHKTLFSI